LVEKVVRPAKGVAVGGTQSVNSLNMVLTCNQRDATFAQSYQPTDTDPTAAETGSQGCKRGDRH
jgi:hypothetical protein